MRYSHLTCLILITLIGVWGIGTARAADLSISPAAYTIDLKAGQENKTSVEIDNNGATDETVQFSIGSRPESQNAPLEWVSITSAKVVSIAAGDKTKVDLSIKPSTDAKTGFYRLVMFVTPNSNNMGNGSSAVVGRLAVSLDVNVLGSDEDGKKWQAAPAQLEIEQIQYHRRWWPSPLKTSLTVKNIGPWKGVPHGTIRLTDTSGHYWQVPINVKQEPLLPDQVATYDLEIPVNYHAGRLYGETIVTLMNETPALLSNNIWVIPWVGPLILLAVIVWAVRRVIRRRSR